MGDASQTLPSLRVRPDDVKGFLASLEGQGRCRSTLLGYASKLDAFLSYLPDGRVLPGTLAAWRDELIARGHSSATANAYLSAANGLVGFLGRRDLQLSGMPAPEHERRPALPRREYLRALIFARSAGRRRDYLLVKSMAVLGLSTSTLPLLDTERLAGRAVGGVPVPEALARELESFTVDEGISSGPVFRGRDGSALSRGAVSAALRSLAKGAGVDPGALCPAALASMRAEAISTIGRRLEPLVERAYDGLLETEQLATEWADGRLRLATPVES